MKNKYAILSSLFLVIFISLSSAYLFLPSYFDSIDNRLRDFYFKFRGSSKASDDIVIVDIDEKSIKALGQWPWQRDKMSQILINLTNADAGIIGLDIVFAEADKTSPRTFAKEWGFKGGNLPDYDEILSQTVAQTPTILGYVFDFDNKNANSAPQVPAIFIQKNKSSTEYLPQANGVLTNISIIQDSAYSSGYMNNIPDYTGIIRSVPLMISFDDMVYPSLAFEMYRLALNQKKVTLTYSDAGISDVFVKPNHIHTDRHARLFLNFRGGAKTYKYISAVDIYENSFDKKDIEGKFILVGTSAYGLMDLRSTPMDSVIAGVEIHANVIDNLLNLDMLIKPEWAEMANIAIIFLVTFLVIFIYSNLSLLGIVFASALSLFAILYGTYFMLFEKFYILNIMFALASLFISLLSVLALKYFFESRQTQLIKQSFSKKVSKQVMDDLLTHPDSADLSSKEVEVTVYFSDIRSFTSISESLNSPKRITEFLNYYMDIMVDAIEKSSGTIDKFIGDAVMAYWNAPLSVKNHADKAVLSALKQISQRDEINVKIKKDFGFEVDYGIGINTGDVVVGEIGSSGRSDYTIIGDGVNLASRLEGLCKAYKVRLIISEFTKSKLTQPYVMQLLDIVRVKGKTKPVKIYEVLSASKPSEQKEKELKEYDKAHDLYIRGNFNEAKSAFEELYNTYEKYLYKLYKHRCEYLEKENIKEFDGVYEFKTK